MIVNYDRKTFIVQVRAHPPFFTMTLAKFGKWPEGEIGAQILRERGERGRKGEREGEREEKGR